MKPCKTVAIIATMLLTVATSTVAQTLNSAYFTNDYKLRHEMNPAFANEQNYFALPVLGNINLKMQGNLGVGDVLYANPDATGKRTVTFMHPSIDRDKALGAISNDGAKTLVDMRFDLLSLGFKAWGGYNTMAISNKFSFGLSLPKSLFEFAKAPENKTYSFDDIAVRGVDYMELAFGHSRQLTRQLRVGAKVKILLAMARADLNVENMSAQLTGDTWTLQGKATGELNLKNVKFERETKEYKSRPGTYEKVTDINTDDAKVSDGTGLAFDLGGVYQLNEDLTLSAAITDLGYIKWKSTATVKNNGQPFEFNGFHDVAMDDDYAANGETFDEQKDSYADQLTDFLNLEAKEDDGSRTTSIAATATIGAEYRLPMYRKMTVGLLLSRHFNGSNFSWNEARLSANWSPLKWLNGGVSLATNSFSTGLGWVVNVHPRGFNFYVGMDHLISKVNDDMVPLTPNANLSLGMSITWGNKGKKKK